MKATSSHRLWGAFRHSVVGFLLTSPPEPGQLGDAIQSLANKSWKHPVTGLEVFFGFSISR